MLSKALTTPEGMGTVWIRKYLTFSYNISYNYKPHMCALVFPITLSLNVKCGALPPEKLKTICQEYTQTMLHLHLTTNYVLNFKGKRGCYYKIMLSSINYNYYSV